MKIVLIVEDETERAFLPALRAFLEPRLKGRMPKLSPHTCNGRIPTEAKLKRVVERHLSGPRSADHVIALTDVYTGSKEFRNATDAKAKMRKWVGVEPKFHPHAAQYDFEAWLLPLWPSIQKLAGHNAAKPGPNPEAVNHTRPPAHRIGEVFEKGGRRSYVKPRDATRLLQENGLEKSVEQCAELKDLVNTILRVCGGESID